MTRQSRSREGPGFSPGMLSALLVTVFATTASAQPPRAVVSPVVERESLTPGATTRIALAVSLPESLHVQSDRPRDESLIPTLLTVEPPPGIRVTAVIYPHPSDFTLEGQSEPLAVFGHEFVVGAELQIAADAATGPVIIPGRFRYQACDDKVCFQPRTERVEWKVVIAASAAGSGVPSAPAFQELALGRRTDPPTGALPFPLPGATPAVPTADTAGDIGVQLARFTTLGTTGGYLNSTDFLQFVSDAEQGIAQKGWFEGRGPLAILLLVLVGGLALNLTPCVLPMIPINLAIIGAGTQAGSRQRGLLLGATYGAAMAIVYGVLGVIVVLTAGTFGTINSSPWFNLGIALLFVVLGLAMFDVVNIDFSKYSSNLAQPTKRGTFGLAFLMGAVAALLAGACVAPVVIQVVLFASSLYTAGNTLALALPFVLGLGMALPWPVAGAGLAALPKPGAWMVRVKQAFGVIIIATAAYYGYLSYTLFDNLRVDASAVSGSVQEKLEQGWTNSLADGLARAEREGKPVLIDFWATWCKNCLTMDQTTLQNAAVTSALDGYVKVKYQAEDLDAEPARSTLARFKAVGLPTYVILRPSSASSN